MMVAIAAFGIEAAALRDRFEERRLAAPVLADEERYAAAKLDVDALRERFEIEREARCTPFVVVGDVLRKKWAGSGQYTRACLSLPRHFRCLFSLAHFPVNRVDESRLIELRDETRVDNVVDRNLRHLGIEFCEKGDQRGGAFFGRIRFSNVRGVAAERLVGVVGLGGIVELQILSEHALHFWGVSLLRYEGDALDDAFHRFQRRVAVLRQVVFAAVQLLVLVGNAQFSEIAQVLVAFFDHERNEAGVHERGVDRTRAHPGDAGRHRAALHERDAVALGVDLEMLQRDFYRGVRRAADAADAYSLSLEVGDVFHLLGRDQVVFERVHEPHDDRLARTRRVRDDRRRARVVGDADLPRRQGLRRQRAALDQDDLRVEAVFPEKSFLARNPQKRRARAERGVAQADFLLRRGEADGTDKKRDRKNDQGGRSQQRSHGSLLARSTRLHLGAGISTPNRTARLSYNVTE